MSVIHALTKFNLTLKALQSPLQRKGNQPVTATVLTAWVLFASTKRKKHLLVNRLKG